MKKIILTKNAPAPIGPYSQATEFGNTLYVSGQIPVNPATGDLIKSSIKDQAVQVMENLKAVVETAGFSMESIVKCSIFLSDMNNFSEVNEVYGNYFEKDFPARETVQVAGLPLNVDVEISAICCK